MHVQCVVVAEQSRARLFLRNRQRKITSEIEDLANPEARLHDQELITDKQGRGLDGQGHNRHAMEVKTGPGKQSAIRFAKTLCAELEAHRNEYEKILLVAPPEFLGLLRESLPHALEKKVVRAIDKELVRKSSKEIEDYLKKLPGPEQ